MGKPAKAAVERPKLTRRTDVTMLEPRPTASYRDAHTCAFCGATGYRHGSAGAGARLFCSRSCHALYKHSRLRPRRPSQRLISQSLPPKQRRPSAAMSDLLRDVLHSPAMWVPRRHLAHR